MTMDLFAGVVFGHPHLVTVHAPGWRPVVQYPIATTASDAESAVPMELDLPATTAIGTDLIEALLR